LFLIKLLAGVLVHFWSNRKNASPPDHVFAWDVGSHRFFVDFFVGEIIQDKTVEK